MSTYSPYLSVRHQVIENFSPDNLNNRKRRKSTNDPEDLKEFYFFKIAAKSQGDWRTTESWLKSLKVHLELFSSPLTDSVRVSMAAQDTENMEGDWEVGDIDSCGDGKEVEARFDDLLNRLELSGGDEKRILDLFAEIISLDEDEQLIR